MHRVHLFELEDLDSVPRPIRDGGKGSASMTGASSRRRSGGALSRRARRRDAVRAGGPPHHVGRTIKRSGDDRSACVATLRVSQHSGCRDTVATGARIRAAAGVARPARSARCNASGLIDTSKQAGSAGRNAVRGRAARIAAAGAAIAPRCEAGLGRVRQGRRIQRRRIQRRWRIDDGITPTTRGEHQRERANEAE